MKFSTAANAVALREHMQDEIRRRRMAIRDLEVAYEQVGIQPQYRIAEDNLLDEIERLAHSLAWLEEYVDEDIENYRPMAGNLRVGDLRAILANMPEEMDDRPVVLDDGEGWYVKVPSVGIPIGLDYESTWTCLTFDKGESWDPRWDI